MFCPECRSEYVAGVSVCEECGAPLVAELPAVPPPEYVAYEEILSTLNPGEIALMKSLLEEAGIDTAGTMVLSADIDDAAAGLRKLGRWQRCLNSELLHRLQGWIYRDSKGRAIRVHRAVQEE